MRQTNYSGTTLWQFDNLSTLVGIRHFVSDRNSISKAHDSTLSLSSTDDRLLVQNNRERIANAMKVNSAKLIFPSQVHKTRVVRATSLTTKDELLETDALVTNEPGLCIAVMSADCVTILLYDSVNRAVGAVHSGWRGTVARILEKTLGMMKQEFGTTGADVWAGIGPSVCQDSYEVGAEVVAEVESAFGKDNNLTIPQSQGKAKLDLWKANKIQLLDFGLQEHRIETSGLCTVKNNNHFYSARKGDAGRFAAGIVIV
ncbi:MAG TPA: peptidoglycan editing factor PgeF [Chryseosolibacter sp.]|nr:peptidoglycan editing factor PgeF [Chryseosolibacter sp.]